jgi:hypothetical protein
MMADVGHGLGAGGHVWENAFGQASEFIGGAVNPFVRVGSTDELGMFKGFVDGGINDGVVSVECGSDIGNLCGEAGHVMLDDYVGLTVTALGVMGMLGWEALALFSAVRTACV